MDRSYSFAVLQALPDKVRAERVNVGVVVASTDGIDLRAPELRKLRILTGHEWHDITETIDSHKVVQRYVISQEKDIVADFAYKNGSMKVVSTLDLRSTKSAHSRACEKGATLFFAKQEYGSQTRPFGVYAVSPEEEATRRSEIEILSGFADGNVFNWLSIEDRQRFSAAFY
jgi:hypothetical protein